MRVPFSSIRPDEQAYESHPGSQPGLMCTFLLDAPPRSKAIPYSCLLAVDTLGEQLVLLRYTNADVTLSLSRGFALRRELLEDLTNFRVALVRSSSQLSIQIRTEPAEDRSCPF